MFIALRNDPVGINMMSLEVYAERIAIADEYIKSLQGTADYQFWQRRFHNFFTGISPEYLDRMSQMPLLESMIFLTKIASMPGGENLDRENPILAEL